MYLLLNSQELYYIPLSKCGGNWLGSKHNANAIALFCYCFVAIVVQIVLFQLLDPLDLCLLCLSVLSL